MKRFSLSLSLAFVPALLSLAHCGQVTPLADVPPPPQGGTSIVLDASKLDEVTQACTAQETAFCDLRDGCTAAVANQVAYGSKDVCVQRNVQSCIAGFTAPDIGNTTAHVSGCASAFPLESCTDWWDGANVDACRSPEGARPGGSECGINSQCASGFCSIGLTNACGTCADTPRAGDPCTQASNCQYGMHCAAPAPGAFGVCVMRGVVGEACDDLVPCEGGLACIGLSSGASGVCRPAQTTAGAACDTESGPGCDSELYLYCTSGTCQPELLVPPGEACGDLGPVGYGRCEAGGVCVFSDGLGTCVAPAADGDPCDIRIGPPCLAPARCVTPEGSSSGTCWFPDPASCQ